MGIVKAVFHSEQNKKNPWSDHGSGEKTLRAGSSVLLSRALHVFCHHLPQLVRGGVCLAVGQDEGAGGGGVEIDGVFAAVQGMHFAPLQPDGFFLFNVVGNGNAAAGQGEGIDAAGQFEASGLFLYAGKKHKNVGKRQRRSNGQQHGTDQYMLFLIDRKKADECKNQQNQRKNGGFAPLLFENEGIEYSKRTKGFAIHFHLDGDAALGHGGCSLYKKRIFHVILAQKRQNCNRFVRKIPLDKQ